MAARALDAGVSGPHPRSAAQRLRDDRGRDRAQLEAQAIARRLSAKVFADIYRFHFRSERRERLFVASLSFGIAFGIVRVITHLIRAGIGPFHNVSAGTLHIHHLVWGILLLLAVGYAWLIQMGTGEAAAPSWFSRATAVAYGVGAALTLDEFALWLNLQDVYWDRAGRLSIDAVIMFAALLSVGIWGGPFLRAVARELVWLRVRR